MILATIKQFNQKQLILVQGEYSKKGHLIYLTRKGSFQVQNDQISIREIKETHEAGQNSNKEASRLYAELLLCVCWHTEHI